MPEIAWAGAIFVAPLGFLTSRDHINVVNAAGFVNPLVMERIICFVHAILHIISCSIGDLHQTPDPHDDCAFQGHSLQMRDLHRHKAPCPYLKRGISGHLLCFGRIGLFYLNFHFRHGECQLYFSGHRGVGKTSFSLGATMTDVLLGDIHGTFCSVCFCSLQMHRQGAAIRYRSQYYQLYVITLYFDRIQITILRLCDSLWTDSVQSVPTYFHYLGIVRMGNPVGETRCHADQVSE